MGRHLPEYDHQLGFRCQCCGEWTYGGNLYSSMKGQRVCFMCHMEEVANEMDRRFQSIVSGDLYGSKENVSIAEDSGILDPRNTIKERNILHER